MEKMTNLFTRNVEIARARCFDVKTLLAYEGTDKSYFLSPDGVFLSKGKKSELQPLLKTKTMLSITWKDPYLSLILWPKPGR